eukprot:1159500-Pelagomonas_calceolata.AAC.3
MSMRGKRLSMRVTPHSKGSKQDALAPECKNAAKDDADNACMCVTLSALGSTLGAGSCVGVLPSPSFASMALPKDVAQTNSYPSCCLLGPLGLMNDLSSAMSSVIIVYGAVFISRICTTQAQHAQHGPPHFSSALRGITYRVPAQIPTL